MKKSSSELWGEFRFGVVGQLLSSPPKRGELQVMLKMLSERTWRHPVSGEPVLYGIATIERWYYRCRSERGAVLVALKRRVRADVGCARALDEKAKEILRRQYLSHPGWSYKLHADNLRAQAEKGNISCPSDAVVRRFMQSTGLFKTRRVRGGNRQGALDALTAAASREVRSFENEYVCGLWHLDFHHCSRQVLVKEGVWRTPVCVAVLDDHSRIACHVQWYLSETTENLVHAFSQALQKRGLPRALLTDNGSPMMSAEFTEGLLRLGIVHETTLPYSPYQNGKQERFFGVLEGRLVAMCENCSSLTLAELNDATCAWVEVEYNRTRHEEISETPLARFLGGKSVRRESPGSDQLREAFRREVSRRQRRTDGTASIEGKRFEIPGRYRSLVDVRLRYAQWDLSVVHLVCPQNGEVLCRLYPQDKAANATSSRRQLSESGATEPDAEVKDETAPLLSLLMAKYASSGLPPAYIPKDDNEKEDEEEK